MKTVDKKSDPENFAAAVNAAFGRKLRRLRRAQEISQGELASRVGLSRVTIATIEAGKQNTQLHHIFLFARALDAPLNSLVPDIREVEQQQHLSDIPGVGRIATSDLFLQDARALLLQLKKGSYEHQAANKKPNRAAGNGSSE